MPQNYDWTGFGVRARCRHEGGEGSLRVWRSEWSPNVIRIDTPTVYNRTEWTVDQAKQLRAVLDAAIREAGK